MNRDPSAKRFIVAVDVGTTTIRACLYNQKGVMETSAEQRLKVEITKGVELHVEIDPESLWRQFKAVVQTVVDAIPAGSVVSMGVCTQRNSFICWDKKTLRPLHPFNVWNDCRARKKVDEWNNSWIIKALNTIGSVFYFISRKPRYKAAKILRFMGSMVFLRLMHKIEEDRHVHQLLMDGQLAYGCMDSWLLLKMSYGRTLITEPSNMSSTGMFDPFINDYNRTILSLVGFPCKILVPMGDSASSTPIVTIPEELFGRSIEVYSVLADQQAALYGVGAWNKGDCMISLGTGTFLEMNTGKEPHASMRGLYPLIGWKINGKTTHVAEGNDHDTSLIIQWAHDIGLYEEVSETSAIAEKAKSSDGVFFVPAFGGLQTPSNDDAAISGFLGLRPSTTKGQMMRAILEAIAFRVHEIHATMLMETAARGGIRICGGISANDFVCQTICTLIDRPIERVENGSFAASKGVALMAGLVQGLWTEQQMPAMVPIERTFRPRPEERPALLRTFTVWQKAVKRCARFYD